MIQLKNGGYYLLRERVMVEEEIVAVYLKEVQAQVLSPPRRCTQYH